MMEPELLSRILEKLDDLHSKLDSLESKLDGFDKHESEHSADLIGLVRLRNGLPPAIRSTTSSSSFPTPADTLTAPLSQSAIESSISPTSVLPKSAPSTDLDTRIKGVVVRSCDIKSGDWLVPNDHPIRPPATGHMHYALENDVSIVFRSSIGVCGTRPPSHVHACVPAYSPRFRPREFRRPDVQCLQRASLAAVLLASGEDQVRRAIPILHTAQPWHPPRPPDDLD
jgi:hypothetical protein